MLFRSNSQSCTDTVRVRLDISPEFSFFIPNSFTPNGDGMNDSFNGQGVGIKYYHLMIFDRWGDLIWETRSISKSWDGKANQGRLMSQQDSFDWKVVLTDVFDKEHVYYGRVSVVK